MVFIFSLGLVFLSDDGVSASSNNNKVTPFGDYCSRMSHYGKNKSIINLKHAEEALKHYYEEKGLDIEIVSSKGRFIKVKIMDEHNLVDTIIFDRKAGRVRSFY